MKHRRPLRLKDFDYATPGAYFVTICVQNRRCLLAEITESGELKLSDYGRIVDVCWNDLPNHYSNIELDAFVIMPNHVHGIIKLHAEPSVGAGLRPAPTGKNDKRPRQPHDLPEIVRAFKSFSARRVNELRKKPGTSLWPRNFYEHVIRTDHDLAETRTYIAANPYRRAGDPDNPDRRNARS